jgi:hypothetical protein
MWSPGYRGYPDKKYIFRQISGSHQQDHPTVLSRILDSSRLAAIFARLELVELLYLEGSASESPSYA